MKPLAIPHGVLFLCLLSISSQADEIGQDLSHTLDTPQFTNMVNQQSANNKTLMTSIGPDAIARAMSQLPKWTTDPGQLKYGQHRTVSPNGEEVITLIRAAMSQEPHKQNTALMKLHEYSEQGIPEAVTFFGFLHDYGLLGLKKDQVEARRYYEAAASRGYQPAIYDLAIHAIYGMGEAKDMRRADRYLAQAMSYGPESSYRVCGMHYFIEYRLGIEGNKQPSIAECESPLVNLTLAQSGHWTSSDKMINGLRQSIGTGVDDGYSLLVHVGQTIAGHDPAFYYCKYSLLDRSRTQQFDKTQLKDEATTCVDQYSPPLFTATQKYLAVSGIVGFIPMEMNELQTLRRSNHFHYNITIPYLPFTQLDMDLLAQSTKPTDRPPPHS